MICRRYGQYWTYIGGVLCSDVADVSAGMHREQMEGLSRVSAVLDVYSRSLV